MFATFNTLAIERPFDSDVLNTPSFYVSDSGFLDLFALLVFCRVVEYKCLLSEMGFEKIIVVYICFLFFRLGKTSQNLHTYAKFMTWGHPRSGTSTEKYVFSQNGDSSKTIEFTK